MGSEFDSYLQERDVREAVWLSAGKLRLVTDYQVAVDTTVRGHADPQDGELALSAETHFYLTAGETAAENHRVMCLDNGVVVGVPNEQMLPVRRTESTQGL